MPNKPLFPKFAEVTSVGIVALICGIGAVSVLFKNLGIACFLGILGIILGITTLRMQVEKFEKFSTAIGMALSIIPLIYALIVFIAE